jgi:hypothetical protein
VPEALNLAVHEQLAGSLNKRHAVRKINLPFDRMYAHGFRHYFTPLSGCFSPFPHGTSTLSVICSYLALEGGPPRFRQDFTCPALLRILLHNNSDSYRPVTFLGGGFPSRFCLRHIAKKKSYNPGSLRFGLLPVRSPLLRESLLMYFPLVT